MADPQPTDVLAPHATATPPADADTLPGTTPGPRPAVPGYALADEVGRGGMGVVYRATDERFDRDVAVKVLADRFPPDSSAARRFRDEARITGRLQHPGVPPVHDLGDLPDGRPFLVMKLVRGRTLDALLKDRPDPAADRGRFVATFESICQAVGFAHEHGVIHRDLKPHNVMVGTFGEVQVMDWGLAKLLASRERQRPEEPEPDDDTDLLRSLTLPARPGDSRTPHFMHTRTGSVLGTPAYMPPEQATGDLGRVDARSDVFGLGAVLCAILTGHPPYLGVDLESTHRLAATADQSAARGRLAACGADPELVALCERCLSPDPADRPADGAAVAVAVHAIRDAADERAKAAERDRDRAAVRAAEERKRRRALAVAGGGLVAALAAGVAGTTIGLVRADRERDAAVFAERQAATERDAKEDARRDAVAARDKAQEVLDAMTAAPAREALAAQPDLGPQQKRFLAGAVGYYRQLAGAAAADKDGRMRVAAAAYRVGGIEDMLGRRPEAEAAYAAAADAYRALAADYPDDRTFARFAGTSLSNVGVHRMDQNRLADAERAFADARTVQERLAAIDPHEPDHRATLATTLSNLGVLYRRQDRAADWRAAHEAALAVRIGLTLEYPDRPDFRNDRAHSHLNLGMALRAADRPDDAAAEYRAALELLAGVVGERPGDHAVRADLGRTYLNLGALLHTRGRFAEAEAAYREALAVHRRLVVDVPGNPDYRRDLGRCHNNLGAAVGKQGRLADELAEHRAAAVRTRLAAAYPRVPGYREDLARSHSAAGSVLGDLGRHPEAAAAHRAAAAVRAALAADFPDDLRLLADRADTHLDLARSLAAQRAWAAAEAEHRTVLGMAERLAAGRAGKEGMVGKACVRLANAVRDAGRPADSLPLYDRGLGLLPPGDPRRDAHWDKAAALVRLGRHADAVPVFDAAIALSKPTDVRVRVDRAEALVTAGRPADAVAAADALDPLRVTDRGHAYDLACVCSRAAEAVPPRRDEYAAKAVGWLRRAVANGWADGRHVWRDADLDPIRDRADVRAILAQLGTPREPAPAPRGKR